jgi:hypothetical protein
MTDEPLFLQVYRKVSLPDFIINEEAVRLISIINKRYRPHSFPEVVPFSFGAPVIFAKL